MLAQRMGFHPYQAYSDNQNNLVTNDHKNYEFDGGNAPLDISRVDDNFELKYQSDEQSIKDSADFLED